MPAIFRPCGKWLCTNQKAAVRHTNVPPAQWQPAGPASTKPGPGQGGLRLCRNSLVHQHPAKMVVGGTVSRTVGKGQGEVLPGLGQYLGGQFFLNHPQLHQPQALLGDQDMAAGAIGTQAGLLFKLCNIVVYSRDLFSSKLKASKRISSSESRIFLVARTIATCSPVSFFFCSRLMIPLAPNRRESSSCGGCSAMAKGRVTVNGCGCCPETSLVPPGDQADNHQGGTAEYRNNQQDRQEKYIILPTLGTVFREKPLQHPGREAGSTGSREVKDRSAYLSIFSSWEGSTGEASTKNSEQLPHHQSNGLPIPEH